MSSPRQPTNQVHTVDEGPAQADAGRGPSFALSKVDLLLAALLLLVAASGHRLGFLPETLALVVLTVTLVAVTSRAVRRRRDPLDSRLLRRPLTREMRPALLQCLHHWLFWALFAAAILSGTFALVPAQVGSLLSLPVPLRIPYLPLLVLLGAGALVMAVLALVPRRHVQVGTNAVVAIGTVFLAVQLVRVHVPPTDPVTINPPLAGEWHTVAGGRSVLLSHHYSVQTPQVRDALDFVRIVDGRGHDGDPEHMSSWYGFGEPVLAPADGTVISVDDTHPDEPLGQTGVTPPHGNHLVLEIGEHRYAVLAHLQQGSAQVSPGSRTRLGQPIAAVGDSGNSLWPHLHFHVQDRPDLDSQARTVPVVFRDVVLTRNGIVSTPVAADLRRGDRFIRVGD